jgi:NAD(P)-dependent dehydrogenase (short-subunit alcohol dehydrogenase family)
MDGLAGKTALVTGGGSGIGRAVALALHDEGCRVSVADLPGEQLERTRNAPECRGVQVFPCDVTSDSSLDQLFIELKELDILIQCAGIIRREQEYDVSVFSQVLDVNLTGSFRVASRAKALLARSGGSIVNTASMLAFFGSPVVPGYSASKGGIVQLTKSLAIAWAKDNIRVNAVAPGWIATELTRPLWQDNDKSYRITDRTPLGRWGTPADLVGSYLFLCSSAAAFITGVTLPVDGGYSIS